MLLTSPDGARVELRPTRYQSPAAPREPGDWDANWLEVHGRVRTATGGSWTFTGSCLTTWEARELGDWLRAAAEGRVPVTEALTEALTQDAAQDAAEDPAGLLTFTEPDLGFSVSAADEDSLVVRVHLSLESGTGRPGSDQGAPATLHRYGVPLRVGREDLLAAARAWEDDLTSFPER